MPIAQSATRIAVYSVSDHRVAAKSRPRAPQRKKVAVTIQPPGPRTRLLTGWRAGSYPGRNASSIRKIATNSGPVTMPHQRPSRAIPSTIWSAGLADALFAGVEPGLLAGGEGDAA